MVAVHNKGSTKLLKNKGRLLDEEVIQKILNWEKQFCAASCISVINLEVEALKSRTSQKEESKEVNELKEKLKKAEQ